MIRRYLHYRRHGNSRRASWRLARLGALVVAVLALAGCGAGGVSSSDEAEGEVKAIVDTQLELQGLAGIDLSDINCVSEGDGRFACVLQVRETNGNVSPVGGTLTCDDDGCLFRGELRGG